VNVAPGTPSVTITFPSGFNATKTETVQIIAMQTSQGVFLPMPATVSAPLTIAPPTLKLAFPVAQTTGNVVLPLTITDNASPNELFPISALLELSSLSISGFEGPALIGLNQQTQTATVMVEVPAVTQPTVATVTGILEGIGIASSTMLTIVPRNTSPLQIEALSIVPGNDDEFVNASDANAQEAHFPLGSTFQINLWQEANGGRTAIPASLALGQSPTFANAATMDPNPLFPDSAVFPFTPQVSPSGQVFQATHLGTQMLTIQPADHTLNPVTLTLVVDPPESLGTTHKDLDARLITLVLLCYKLGSSFGFLREL
jgi:hypothetical protein